MSTSPTEQTPSFSVLRNAVRQFLARVQPAVTDLEKNVPEHCCMTCTARVLDLRAALDNLQHSHDWDARTAATPPEGQAMSESPTEQHPYLARPIMDWLRERENESLAGRKFTETRKLIELLRRENAAMRAALGRGERGGTSPASNEQRDGMERVAEEYAAKAERLKCEMEAIWKHCQVIYYPGGGAYPLEHNPHARKDCRTMIEAALRATTPPEDKP